MLHLEESEHPDKFSNTINLVAQGNLNIDEAKPY